MFVFGGNTTKSSFNDLWEYDVAGCEWKLVKTHGAVLSPSPSRPASSRACVLRWRLPLITRTDAVFCLVMSVKH